PRRPGGTPVSAHSRSRTSRSPPPPACRAWCDSSVATCCSWPASAQQGELDEHAGEEEQRQAAHQQGGPQVIGFAGAHHFTSGGFSKVWNGAGLGTVHSRPSAPSHGFAGALAPPRMVGSTTANRKYTWLQPKPNAPIDTIILKSVNCTA